MTGLITRQQPSGALTIQKNAQAGNGTPVAIAGFNGARMVQVDNSDTAGTANLQLQGSFDEVNWFNLGYQQVDATAAPARAVAAIAVAAAAPVLATPGATTSIASPTAGTLSTTTAYSYVTTFLNSAGQETVAGAASAAITPTATDPSITVTPPAAASGMAKYNIYRQAGAGTPFDLVHSVTATTTVAWTDSGAVGTAQTPPVMTPAQAPSAHVYQLLDYYDWVRAVLSGAAGFTSGGITVTVTSVAV